MKRRSFFARVFGAVAATAVAPVVAKALKDTPVTAPLASDTFTGAPFIVGYSDAPDTVIYAFDNSGFTTITTTSMTDNRLGYYVVNG